MMIFGGMIQIGYHYMRYGCHLANAEEIVFNKEW
jgi:hypothetical protein